MYQMEYSFNLLSIKISILRDIQTHTLVRMKFQGAYRSCGFIYLFLWQRWGLVCCCHFMTITCLFYQRCSSVTSNENPTSWLFLWQTRPQHKHLGKKGKVRIEQGLFQSICEFYDTNPCCISDQQLTKNMFTLPISCILQAISKRNNNTNEPE